MSCALAERDLAAATSALNAFGEMPLTDYAVHSNRSLVEALSLGSRKTKAKPALHSRPLALSRRKPFKPKQITVRCYACWV
jgi:hypothetical protein